MIPKTIHYCWFGGKDKPKLAKKCIASWKKYCPDYEIVEWNETNFDVNESPYTRWCYKNEKWAFLSDYVRLAVVEKYGGVYFDTDVELLRKPDFLLQHEAFFGFENDAYINTGHGFGAETGHETVKAMLTFYDALKPDSNGEFPLAACPRWNTEALEQVGLCSNGLRQRVAGAEIYPPEFFNPLDDATGSLNITPQTVSVHWYSKSWMSPGMILRSKLTKPFHRIFGKDCFAWLK